jgi:hypothetical protein
LRAITDDCDLFALDEGQVSGIIVIKMSHSFVSSRGPFCGR